MSAVEHGRLGQFLAGASLRVHMHVMKLEIEYKNYWNAMKRHRKATSDEPMRNYCKALAERVRAFFQTDEARESALSYITEGCGLEF